MSSSVLYIYQNIFLTVGDTEQFFYEPLEVTQCLDIGYSASVRVRCATDTRCANQNFNSQQALQNTVFLDSHPLSVYSDKCGFNRRILTLFACSWFLPAADQPGAYIGKSTCKSFCNGKSALNYIMLKIKKILAVSFCCYIPIQLFFVLVIRIHLPPL